MEEVQQPPDDLIDLQDLAAATKLPVAWLRAATKRGDIPGLRVGSQVRYSLAAVRRRLSELATGKAAPLGAGTGKKKKGPAIVAVSTGA